MTINLHPVGDPSARGWGPGWPHCSSEKWVPVTLSNGVPIVGGMRREVAELFTIIANECIRRGYRIYTPGCWGAQCRPIDGTKTASLHSFGLAADINAPSNPMQDRVPPIATDHPSWYVALWNRYGWRNGIQYLAPHDVDPMHNEFMGTPADAVAMLALAKAELLKPALAPKKEAQAEAMMYLTRKTASQGQQARLIGPDGKTVVPPVLMANRLSNAGIVYDRGDDNLGVSASDQAWYEAHYGRPV